MRQLVEVLDDFPAFQWCSSWGDDAHFLGLTFGVSGGSPGLHRDRDWEDDEWLEIDVYHGHLGFDTVECALSAFLQEQLLQSLKSAGYETEDWNMSIGVRTKATDIGPLWMKYREAHMDSYWVPYELDWVCQMRRERKRLRTVFQVLKQLGRVSHIKQQLMEKACHPSRLWQIG